MRNPSDPTVKFKIERKTKAGVHPPVLCEFRWKYGKLPYQRNGIDLLIDPTGYHLDVSFNVWSPRRWKLWFNTRPLVVKLRTNYIRRWMADQIHQAHGIPSDLLLWDGVDPSAARRADDYRVSTSFWHRGRW